MNELYKMVQDRQDAIARLVADKEAEIEALQAESKKLDSFLNLGKELFDKGAPAPAAATQPQAQPQAQAPREVPQPVQQPRQAAPEPAAKAPPPEMPRILPARQPREQDQSPKLA